MDYVFEEKYLKISPKKMRFLVKDLLRYSPKEALQKLPLQTGRVPAVFYRVIKSAYSSIVNNHKVAEDKIIFKTIMVNQGPVLKRFRAGPRGVAKPYKRRSSHVRIILTTKKEIASQQKQLPEKINVIPAKAEGPVRTGNYKN